MRLIVYLICLISFQIGWAQSIEDCTNARDDDQDGLIDLQDPDCACDESLIPSPIPNPSFENYSCCPNAQAQLGCADYWIDASEPTPDFFHMCGWQDFPSYQVPLPLPDGEGFVGFRNGQFEGAVLEPYWKEYAGACLNYSLIAGETYLFEMYVGFGDDRHSPPLDFTFWGAESCGGLPFGAGDPAFGCPEKVFQWHQLGQVWIDGDREWLRVEMEITPSVEINAVAFGPGCRDSMAKPNPYYFLDHIVLLEGAEVTGTISPVNPPCSPDASLEVTASLNFTQEVPIQFQWYKDEVALVGETGPELTRMYGDGTYLVRFKDPNGACALSDPYLYEKPESYQELQFAICEGGSYMLGQEELTQEGVYLDTLKTTEGCDSIVLLDLQVKAELAETVVAKILPTETYQVGPRLFNQPGAYEIFLRSDQGCDSVVYLQLSFLELFAPTAFSPNGDGLNDSFALVGGKDVVAISTFKVFNRWGKLVYEAEGLPPDGGEGWDGISKGRASPEGLYVFAANVLYNDGIERMSSGSFVLLR